jgi:DNA repair photolyase
MTENIKGRGSQFNLKNRFEKFHLDDDPEFKDEIYEDEEKKIQTTFYNDHTKTILAKNDSPDLSFTYSINPYRGCEHGCIYCYARPTHDYLGFSTGLDFETKVMVKKNAPELLREAFSKKSWKPQVIILSGNTDCYQPVERKLEITREILKVFLEFRNPVAIITKNALIQRDIDILKELNEYDLVSVILSITTLKPELQRIMEPRTSSPSRRLDTVKFLSENNIPAGVNVAPVIPGLTDEEMPEILKAASENGALSAGKVMLRLPHGVKDLFVDWVKKNFPERADKIINRILNLRDGKLYNSEWGSRMKGSGKWAEMVDDIFQKNCRRYNLNVVKRNLTTEHFRRKVLNQFELF